MIKTLSFIIFLTSVTNTWAAGPMNLLDAYNKSLRYDAQYGSARYNNMGVKEELEMAKAGFMPKIGLSYSQGRSMQDRTPSINGVTSFYGTQNITLSVRQPIYSKQVLASYRQAGAYVAQSDALLAKEESSLFTRVMSNYLNVLYASDNIEHSSVLKASAMAQLASAELRFKMGQGTVTEISEARAAKDKAIAEELIWMNTLEFNRRNLEMIVGEYPSQLLKLDPTKIEKKIPAPSTVDQWVQLALANNPDILAANQEVEIAIQEVEKRKSGHYPTVDLVASRTRSESETNYAIGSTFDTTGLSVQANIPIYSGGYVSSSIRQGGDKLNEAKGKLEVKLRSVSSDVRKYFNALSNGAAQQVAFENTVKASDDSLTGTIKGFKFGLRSNIEVLTANEKLYKSQVDLSSSRYEFVNNLVSLLDVAGIIKLENVVELNAWFIPSASSN
jgi:protease secretion system outer membrane protein